MMELKTVKDEFDRVTKMQKLLHSKMQETVDRLCQEIEKTLNMIQEANSDVDNPLHHKSAVGDLKNLVKDIYPSNQLESREKELSTAQTKYLKALEQTLTQDISMAYRNVEFDSSILNQIIAQFLYRQGLFDIGDKFISEIGEPEFPARQSFVDMYMILNAMQEGDLEPAFNWAASKSDKLKEANSDLEMRLHSLQILKIAQNQNTNEAITYAKTHMGNYWESCFSEIQKLMCSLLWITKQDKSPYSELHSPTFWTKVAKELTRQYCSLLGEPSECPSLSTTIAAGSQALPHFLKYLNRMVHKRKEWQTMKELPIDVELSDDLTFHSVFVCPVSKEETSKDNPPMRLPCGHVFSQQSINENLEQNESESLKCPFCRQNVNALQCRQLYF